MNRLITGAARAVARWWHASFPTASHERSRVEAERQALLDALYPHRRVR